MTAEHKRVIIIEDDLELNSVVRDIIVFAGIPHEAILEATSMEGALDTIEKRGTPKVAVLDLHLGTKNDLEAIKVLSNLGIPVVVLSADNSPGIIEDCLNLGAVGFIEKPFEIDDLINKIKKFSS